MSEPAAVLARLWGAAGCDASALERVELAGSDPVLSTNFKLGTAAATSIAASALAATEVWRLRTGRRQRVRVGMRAAVAAFRSERYLRIGGQKPPDPWSPVSGFYRAGNGRWIQLHCNFPHHRDGVLRVLGCDGTRDAVAAAVASWKTAELEDVLAAAGMCAGMVRPAPEWRAHPHAQAVAGLPLFEILRIGDARPEPFDRGDRPLSDVRVLDLTRVIAGPVCGRTLAEHGADVLLITAAHLPSIELLAMDTGRGKRSAFLDLRRSDDAGRLRDLIRQADVFCEAYRPGALAAHGFALEDVARLRPGIVYVTLSAYGHVGPWRERRGFDSLVQSVSGIAHEGGLAAGTDGPKHLPAQALDHATGYLAAFGATVALARRALEGGSYLVRLSLAQTGHWIDQLGRVDGHGAPELRLEDIDDLLETADTPFGRLRYVVPAAQLSETPAYWARPAAPLGTHEPAF